MSVDDESIVAARQHTGPESAAWGVPALDRLLVEIADRANALQGLAPSDASSAESGYRALVGQDEELRSRLALLSQAMGNLGRGNSDTARRVMEVGRDAFGSLVEAWQSCLGACELLEAADHRPRLWHQEARGRMVRAGAGRVIWERCCGGPALERLWQWLGSALVMTATVGRVRVGAGLAGAGEPLALVEREYLRAVAAYSAALDILPPHLLGAMERLLEYCLPMLQLQRGPLAGATYYVAPGSSASPERMARSPEIVAGLWFFSPRVAVSAMKEIAARLASGKVPAALAVEGDEQELLRGAMDHLLRHWSHTPPVRRYRRHLVGGTLSAVCGIGDLERLFAGKGGVRHSEWTFRDVSRGGIGAYVTNPAQNTVRVGELVGVCPCDGGIWQLAVVRRTWSDPEALSFIGLETLSQKPVLARVDDGRTSMNVLLCDPLLRGEAVRVAAPQNTLGYGSALFVASGGSIHKLKPLGGSMSGEGFELRVYQVL